MAKHDGASPGRWSGSVAWIAAVIAFVPLIGCGSGNAGTTSGTGASASSGSGGGGPGQFSGTVAGHTVGAVGAAYFIGQSDDPAHTTVVYMFDSPVTCADLGAAGWDKKIADKTGALEMKLIGKTPMKYPVASSPNPAQGEATVNFTETSQSATPQEDGSTSGDVQLETLVDGKLATGTFDLTFSQGSLKGSFFATWCPGGHEP